MKEKVIKIEELKQLVSDNQSIMVGGFLKCGYPDELVQTLLVENSASNLTVISNDTGTNDSSFFTLLDSGKVSQVHASYIGGNKATGKKYFSNPNTVHLYPQGSLSEKIRCGGGGLGGVLTKVGLGTIVENDKQKVMISGEEFLIEEQLRADIALIYARRADRQGNLQMVGTEINFNSIMATAADTTIVLVDEVVETGEITPEAITVPSIFIDYLVIKEGSNG